MSIVAKFGGSSMADATAMRRSAKVASEQAGLQLIIVSATYGTTNQLIELAKKAEYEKWPKARNLYKKIEERHLQIAKELLADDETLEKIKQLLNEAKTMAKGMNYLKDCSAKAMDSLYSVGERLSSTLFLLAVKEAMPDKEIKWLDARTVLRTNDNFGMAFPELPIIAELCEEKLRKDLDNDVLFISQGFIGSNSDGLTTTLGRGGSDYSAALLAEGIKADTLQIWTDVAGISTTDPRICPSARPLEEISFTEAAELATFGAKILHPTTIWPVMRQNINVFVGSSIESQKKGTWIRKSTDNAPLIRAIALRERQSIVTVTTPRMVSVHGYLADIFNIFRDHQVSVDLITTSEISVSITVNHTTLVNCELLAALEKLGLVKVENNYALVSLIGNNINHTPGLAKNILTTINEINVRLIATGASVHNFCFLVAQKDGVEAVKRLHQRFLD